MEIMYGKYISRKPFFKKWLELGDASEIYLPLKWLVKATSFDLSSSKLTDKLIQILKSSGLLDVSETV